MSVRVTLPRATATRLGLPRRSLLTLSSSIDGSRSLMLRLPADAVYRAHNARLSRLGVLATVTATTPGAPSATRKALLLVGL